MHPTNVPSRSRAFFYVPPTADIELGWLLCTPIKRWLSKATAPSPLSYFSSIYFDDRTDDTAHPQVFRLSRASSLTPPSSLTPILFDCCVLICKTAATFKAQASPIPLFFDPSLFAPLNKQTNDIERKPDGPKAGRASPAGGGFMVSQTPTGTTRREQEEERGGISTESLLR